MTVVFISGVSTQFPDKLRRQALRQQSRNSSCPQRRLRTPEEKRKFKCEGVTDRNLANKARHVPVVIKSLESLVSDGPDMEKKLSRNFLH